jgi:undecaprenyl-phosphate 4-deoxy-4-formamido-L-arabinose transferase
MKTDSCSLSIVIPVYRSAGTLPELVDRVNRVLDRLPGPSEILLVNDGSPDPSWQVIAALAASQPRLRGINLMKNYGQHSALLAGIMASRGGMIVTLDDDLQTPPEEIPRLLDELNKGFDLVYGARERERHDPFRNACSVGIKWALSRLLGVQAAKEMTSFRIFRSELRRSFDGRVGSRVFLDALLCWGTSRIGSVVVAHRRRDGGNSGYSMRRLAGHAVSMITSFSHIPLQIAGYLGLATTLLGVVLLAHVLGTYVIVGRVVPGFTFLAAALILFSGVQLFVLGVMGEYLAAMHQRLMGAPSYVIREEIGNAHDEGSGSAS